MYPKHLIPLTFSAAACCSIANAQQAIDVNDDFALPDLILDQVNDQRADQIADQIVDQIIGPYSGSLSNTHTARSSSLETISIEQLSIMRSTGIDPSWISDRLEIPEFDLTLHRLTQGDHPFTIESWATGLTDHRGMQINDSLIFSVGRTTALRDGNIAGNAGTLNTDTSGEHVPSLAQAEGEYDIYDIALEWEAIKAGPVTFSLLSGIKAIEANIGKPVTINGDTTTDIERRFAALPMVGSGIHWQISENFSFSGAALTLPIETGDALIDFNASTDLRISSNIGFVTGYRIIRTSFDVGSVSSDLTQEGLFARLEISF